MGISPAEYLKRLQPMLNLEAIKSITQKIILSDQSNLKAEKVNEFEQGLRPDGEKIGTYRNADYAIDKFNINPRAGGYVDLLLTRSFANKMFITPTQKGFIFNSSDSKTGNLIGKYGLDIMGLNQEWFTKRQNEVYRLTLVYQIKKQLRIG